MSKKENEREVTSLLARIRESLRRPKKENEAEEIREDSFDRDLSERLEKHLGTKPEDKTGLREGDDESDFAVEELEIVTDGTLDPEQVEESAQEQDIPDEETVEAAEQALFSDLDALMARMTPEQRAQFEAEMNAVDESAEDMPQGDETEETVSEEKFAEEAPIEEAAVAEEPAVQDAVPAEPMPEYAHPVAEDVRAAVEESNETEIPAEDEAQEGEIYTAVEEDEDYDLSETEAFRALEARMTPEQRAQFEQALAEAQEAERAEKEARREARRAAQESAVQEAEGAEITLEISESPEMLTESAAQEQAPITETAAAAEKSDTAVAEADTLEQPAEDMPCRMDDAEEPITVELPPVEETEDNGVPITLSAQEDMPSESTIFMAVGEDDDENDMPAIKVGSDPSAFTLVVEPEPEIEPEPEPSEEEILADLLARMTPEQRERFRKEMFADEVEEDTYVPTSDGTDDVFVVDGDDEVVTDEPETPLVPDSETILIADESDATSDTFVDEPATEPESVDAANDIDVADEESEGTEREDAIAAVLNDPEKLEELMSRLTPEQAAELREMLGADEEDADEVLEDEVSEDESDVQPAQDEAEETVAEVIVDETTEEGASLEEDPAEENESVLLEEEEDADISGEYENSDETLGDTDDGVAFEYSRTVEDAETEEELEDEEDMNVFEISDDMSDEEISLMLGLGYEKELVYTLGAERVEQVKKRAARENARDPEFVNAYAYEGEEYRSTDQNERIRYRYQVDRRRLWIRLIGTSIFALLLFLYECCGLFRGAFGDIFNAAHYPVIAIMTGWQLLVFASAFSWKQLLHGIRSAFVMEPDNHAMTAIVVAAVMFNNILMAVVFKGSNLYLYNFPAALCLLCSVLCDLADLTRETLTFDVVSSDAKKYVSEAVTLTSAHTSMPIMPMEDEKNNPLSSKNAMLVRRVGFVKNYFRRTNRKTHHAQILNFVFLPLLAFAIVMGVVTALIGNGIAPALSGFVVSILLCMPLSYTVIHTLPLFYEARRLHKQGCAIVGEGTVEECNQFPTVVFEDKDIFPPSLITTKGLKLYENNQIYSVILKISLLFREIGGPINEVLDLDKEEMKRFLASGRAGALENGQVYLDSVSEDGVTARLGDGSRVVAGSASFLASHGIYVRVSEKDQQLIDSRELSILFLAFDGKLGARFYVDYRPDPEFEALAGMLHEDGFRLAIRTLDPGIHEEMIARKCPPEMPEVGTVRAKMRELTSKTGSDAKVDGGLVCSDDPRRMLLPLRAIRNLRRLNRFSLRLYAIALLINMAVVVVLTACSAVGFMSSLFVSLYMLVWLITSLVTTALFLNK